MVKRRILVVDDSPAMRETLCVLLGGEYDVAAVATDDLSFTAAGPPIDLTIAPITLPEPGRLPPAARLWLGGQHLPRQFRPTQLRRHVAAALAGQPPAGTAPAADWRLGEPFLEPDACEVIERAATTGLALHIVGEAGSGKHAVARALHLRTGGAFLVCDADRPAPPGADFNRGPGTLLVIGVDRWSPAAQRDLAASLDCGRTHRLQVISTATCDLAELVDSGDFRADLFYHLTLLAIRLRPLRDRPLDIPALALAIAAESAQRLQRPTPNISSAALARLSRYLWFGNVAELEAVLTRTLALTPGELIEAEDLAFTGTSPRRPAPRPFAPPTTDTLAPTHSAAPNLNLLIHELAHEFKNPLVTIKTFAQHCRRSLRDGDPDETRFAQMTDHAVDRMDETLENLLAFTRLRRPVPQIVPLESLIERVAGNGSGTRLDYAAGPHVSVRVDPDQAAYALNNLLRAMVRGANVNQPVLVRQAMAGTLKCAVPLGGSGEKLSELISDGTAIGEMPLGVAIASAVLERNGANLAWGQEGDNRTALIHFPVVEAGGEAEERRDGTTESTDR